MFGRISRSHLWLVAWESIALMWLIASLNRFSNANGLVPRADDFSPMAWSLLVEAGQALAFSVAAAVIGILPAAWSSIARNQVDGGMLRDATLAKYRPAEVPQD